MTRHLIQDRLLSLPAVGEGGDQRLRVGYRRTVRRPVDLIRTAQQPIKPSE